MKGFEDVVRKVYTFQIERDSTWEMYWASVDKRRAVIRLDHQPLFWKGVRVPPPKFLTERDADQKRESGGNRAYAVISKHCMK